MKKILCFFVLTITLIGAMGVRSFAASKCADDSCCETSGSKCEGEVLGDKNGDPLDCDDGKCYRCDDGTTSGFCRAATDDDDSDSCHYSVGQRATCGQRVQYDCANDTCSENNRQELETDCDPFSCTEEEC